MLGVGAAPQPFTLKNTQGAPCSLETLLRNGPVLLAFFKVSCPVCQLSAPFLERLSRTSGLQVIGISQDDASSTSSFNQRFGIAFPVLLDESRARYPVSNAFGIGSVPSMFLIEPDGIVSSAFSGFSKRDFEQLGQRLSISLFRPGEDVPAFRAG